MSDDQGPRNSEHRGRHRGRRGVISRSPNRDDYERLLAAGWSSLACERYALARYGEDIPAPTFRRHRLQMEARGQEIKPLVNADFDPDVIIDVITCRQELALLQRARLSVAVDAEKNRGRLASGTAAEVRLYAWLLDKLQEHFEQLGIMPTREELENPPLPPAAPAPAQPAPAERPRNVRRLGELLGPIESHELELRVARMVDDVLPRRQPGQGSHSVIVIDQSQDHEDQSAR